MSPRVSHAVLTLFVISIPFVGWAVEAGVALSASHLLAMSVMALAALTWLRDQRPLLPDLAVGSSIAFLAVAAGSVIVLRLEPDVIVVGESAHWKSSKQLAGLAFGIALFTSLYALLRWHGSGLRILRVHYWVTAAFGVATILQYGLALADMQSPWANFPVRNSTLGGLRPLSLMYGFPRVSLTMVEPSTLAGYLMTGWGFWLFTVDRPPFPTVRARTLFVVSGVILGVAIVLTGSRLAYTGVAALILGALVLRPHRVWRGSLIGASVLAGLLLTGAQHTQTLIASLIPKPSPPAARTATPAPTDHASDPLGASMEPPAAAAPAEPPAAGETIESAVRGLDMSVQQRTASYLVAMRVLGARPLLGGGFGTSSFYMERYWPETFIPLHDTRVAGPTMMSHYATVVTETGLLGAVCLFVFAFALARRLWVLSLTGPENRRLALGLGAMLASYYMTAAGAALIVYQILTAWLLFALVLTVRAEDEDA